LLQFRLQAELINLSYGRFELCVLGGELITLGFHRRQLALQFLTASVADGADLTGDGGDDTAHSVLDRIEGAPAVELDERQAGDHEQRDQEDRLPGVQRRHRRTSPGRL
jgi:hypothetical protein